MPNLEQAIRERAYLLWVADDCRDGNADKHWLAAQREILAASLGGIARVKVADADAASGKKSARKGKAVSKAKGKRRAA